MKHRIYLVDDHPIMRRGFTSLINRERDMFVCGEAASAPAALAQFADATPDLAIVDISLGGMDGIELTKRLRAHHPDVRILVVSIRDEVLYAERALSAGAQGYIMKSEADGTLVVTTIRTILNGRVYLSETMRDRLLTQYFSERGKAGRPAIERLSDRELEVFELIGQGFSTRRIADALSISVKTVETHRMRIKPKLGLETGIELVRRAMQWVQEEQAGPDA